MRSLSRSIRCTVRPLPRIAFAFLLFSLAAALVYAGWAVLRLAPIGTAYAAKTLCSGVFVSGRPARAVIEEDIFADSHPLLKLVVPSLDPQRRRASATFLGIAERIAQFRPGSGCTLALGVEPDVLARAASGLPLRGLPSDPLTPGPLPPDAHMDALNAALSHAFADRSARTRAVAVLYDGHVVAERYAEGFSSRTPMPGWSMTKTVVAALAGVLIGRGDLQLGQSSLLEEWRTPGDARAEITLEHLLRMTDGLGFDEQASDPFSDVVQMLFATGDSSAFAAAKPLRTAPGTAWRYASGSTNVLVRTLCRFARMAPEAFARLPRDALFGPLGMRSALIELDAAGVPVGSSFMFASPHDWLRFGQFLLQDGVWQGQRVLPSGWVDYMRTATPQAPDGKYGAHLWLQVPEPFRGRGQPAPALPADAFHLAGHEGQLLSIVPSRRLVVLRLGLTRGGAGWDHQGFLAEVLAALPAAH